MLVSSVISATKAVAGTTGVVLRTNTGSMHTVTDRYMVSSPTSFHIRRSKLARVMFASDVPCSGGYIGMGRLDVTSVFTRAVGHIVGGRSVDSRCVVWGVRRRRRWGGMRLSDSAFFLFVGFCFGCSDHPGL